MKTTILPYQTLLDIALQTQGDASAAMDLAFGNSVSLTDGLLPGQVLETGVPATVPAAVYLSGSPCATALDTEGGTEVVRFQGVNFMVVEGTAEDANWVR